MSASAEYVIRAMKEVEAEYGKTLCYLSDYLKSKGENWKLSLDMFTTHDDLFDRPSPYSSVLPSLRGTYRLKPNVSASEALRTFIKTGESVIDCGIAITLAYYLALLLALENKFGTKEGQFRFDCLFGSSWYDTPTVQRMLISSHVFSGSDKNVFDSQANAVLPLNPLSCFTEYTPLAQYYAEEVLAGRKLDPRLKKVLVPGSIIGIRGLSDYFKKHPLGEYENLNCIVAHSNVEDKLLLSFSEGSVAKTELKMKMRMVEAYNSPPTPWSEHQRPAGTRYLAQISLRDIPGIDLGTNVGFTKEGWDLVLNPDIHTVVRNMHLRLNDILKRKKVLVSRLSAARQNPIRNFDVFLQEKPLPGFLEQSYYVSSAWLRSIKHITGVESSQLIRFPRYLLPDLENESTANRFKSTLVNPSEWEMLLYCFREYQRVKLSCKTVDNLEAYGLQRIELTLTHDQLITTMKLFPPVTFEPVPGKLDLYYATGEPSCIEQLKNSLKWFDRLRAKFSATA